MLRGVGGWSGALFVGFGSLLSWAGRRFLDALHGRSARQPFGLVLGAVSLFTLVAMLDYSAGHPEMNLCGQVGHHFADALVRVFGLGGFVIPFFGLFWGMARLFREKQGSSPLLKLVGVLVLAVTVGLCARAWSGVNGSSTFPVGVGGWFGNHYYPPISTALGEFGSITLLVLLLGLSSLFATEWAFVPLIRELARRGRESLRQPDLPLAPDRRSLREETRENQEWATRGVVGTWNRFKLLLSPYHPEGERSQAAEVVGKGKVAAAEAAPEVQPDRPPLTSIPAIIPQAGPVDIPEAEAPVEPTPEPAVAAQPKAAPAPVSQPEPAVAVISKPESLPGISAAPEEKSAGVDRENEIPARKRRKKPRLDSLPSAAKILQPGEKVDRSAMQSEIDAMGRRLQEVFDAFGLNASVVGAERGPTLTLFEVQLAQGVSVKRLNNQRDDLGVALGSHGVRIVYPLPGRTTVGVEVPNLRRDPVRLKDVYEGADLDVARNKLPMVLGRDTLGKPAVEDLTKMPHMLVAGTTGSGKSVCLNSILLTMLLTRTPEQVRMVLIDPKQVELQLYQDIPHLLCPVVTDMKRAPFTLEWAVRAMEDRLHQFKMAVVRDIKEYNALGQKELRSRLGDDYDPDEFPDTVPYYVLVIDELADLMMVSKKEVEIAISRLAAKARAAGIHLLVATQRPSTDVVTGLIKMNLPVRAAFRVTSLVDSRVILDDGGAEALLGNGDFLYKPPGASGMVRGQGAFVSNKEVREVCDHLRKHGKPEFLEDLVQMKGAAGGGGEVDDPLYADACRIILQSGRGSASLLQRALSIGYTRASRLIDIMTEQGVLGPFVGSKAREVLMTLEEFEATQQ
ncbi:MAG: DNA translocase FtsK [Planctomycetes bacterium]|nr:DNA translocase FtsK [Planctomycetota bacterium]